MDMMSAKRKRRDRSPSLSSDSKENIDFDEEDNPDRANDSDDSLDMEISSIGETSFLNSQDKSNYIECGTIKSLKLVNFMCHGHFAIEFGPRINFVIGRNGSGKSAILTAIVLALGGRSHHTSRGQSLKSFIKTGESRAKIVIKLNNFNNIDKSASFKYEEYGDTIWIERLLKSDGSSTYHLKNKNGKSITTMKKELDTIVKHFNIQIDNPIVVLNQEISRNFLNSKNPRDKYSFFMKATQLEDILNDYAYASEKTTLTELELDKKKKVLKDVASELKELKKKVSLFAKIDDQNNKLSSLDKELLWALVCEKEREFEEILSKIEENNGKVIEHTTTINKLENKLTKFSADKENTQKDLDDMAIKVDEIKAKIGEKTQILTEYKEKKNNFAIECSRLKNELDAMGKDEKHLERKINELKKQFGDVEKVEQERHLRAEMVAKLEEEERQLKAEIRTRKLHKEQLQGSISEIEKKIYGCKAEIDSIKSSIYRKKQDIQQARSSENDQLLRFGVYMPHLLKQIDLEFKQGRFVKKPLGPIGHLIKLRDPGAAFAVECCIKGLVSAFCCDNQGDANVLSQLFKRTLGNARPPMIITRRFTNLHNVSSNCIQSDKYKSILELLDIDQAPVANVLIDRSNIESIAYIANEDEALNVMTNAEKVPHNCNQAYTKQGTNMYPVKRNQFFKSYAPNYNQAKYLTHDISDYILSLEHELVELNKKWEARTADLTPLQENLQENKLDLVETTNKLSKLYDRANEVSRELEELKNVVETTPVEMDLFEKDLSDLRMEKTTRNEKLAGLQEKYSEMKTLIEEINVKITTLQDEKTRLCHEERPAREKMKTLEDQLVSVQRTLNRFKDNLSSVEEEIHDLKKAQESKKQEVENMRQKAMEETGQEIRTTRSPSDVKKEIVDIKRFMQEQESEIGDRDKIIKQYNDRIEAHERVLEQVETFEELLEEFKASTKMRLDKYRRLRKQITEKACQVFKIALDALNFSGILEINHDDCIIDGASKKAKTLDIKINPKVMVNSDVYKDTRSLSGGERSYGTVAFLVALWESCNSPFRILDEVDVFMDVVTRSTAMQILVENAKMKAGKQYIFLSPLGLVVDEKYVHVHRMPDPVRGISNVLSHTD